MTKSTQDEIARCQREIAECRALLLAGHPEMDGLLLAISDWAEEMRMIQAGMTDRELDAAVAEMMGGLVQRDDLGNLIVTFHANTPEEKTYCIDDVQCCAAPDGMFQPSTDPVASQALRVFMRANGWIYWIECNPEEFRAEFWKPDTGHDFEVEAEAELRAVAEAAYRATTEGKS